MRAISYITEPDKTDATIMLTMSLRDWKQVRDALQSNSASGPWHVNRVISELVTKMEERFYPRTEE